MESAVIFARSKLRGNSAIVESQRCRASDGTDRRRPCVRGCCSYRPAHGPWVPRHLCIGDACRESESIGFRSSGSAACGRYSDSRLCSPSGSVRVSLGNRWVCGFGVRRGDGSRRRLVTFRGRALEVSHHARWSVLPRAADPALAERALGHTRANPLRLVAGGLPRLLLVNLSVGGGRRGRMSRPR